MFPESIAVPAPDLFTPVPPSLAEMVPAASVTAFATVSVPVPVMNPPFTVRFATVSSFAPRLRIPAVIVSVAVSAIWLPSCSTTLFSAPFAFGALIVRLPAMELPPAAFSRSCPPVTEVRPVYVFVDWNST